MRVIVADDDLEFLDLIATTFEDSGDDVVCARCGEDLRRELASGAFDAVVTDVSMPRSTGLAVLRSVRAAGRYIPAVVMTALRDRATFGQVAALGHHVALLYKPFSLGALRSAMRACLAA